MCNSAVLEIPTHEVQANEDSWYCLRGLPSFKPTLSNGMLSTAPGCYSETVDIPRSELLFCMATAGQLLAKDKERGEKKPQHHPAAISERWAGVVSVIVPVYNEVGHVDELLQAIHASPVKKEIIIVDDGSTDGTREKLRAMPLANDVTVVFHEKNFGKGAAIRSALQYARGEYILIQDSDLEYDPQDYPALLCPLQQRHANVVYGVRPARPQRGLV